MNLKTIVTVIILLFVAGSLGWMIVRETGNPAAPPDAESATPAPDSQAPARQILVYYFHGDVRCPTCHKLESYAQQAVQTRFPEELAAGAVVWKPVNVDKPENTHFVKDYELVTKTVILSDQVDGKQVAFENLDKIWDLVGDKEEYIRYIQQNLEKFVEEDHS